VVVGDDASTDGTATILAEYARRYPDIIVPIFQPQNVGAAKNWQTVLDQCAGEYIAHVDGDDLMRPGKLQRQADFLDANSGIAACFHNMRVFDSATNRTLYHFTPPGAPSEVDLEGIVRLGTIYCHSSKMYRKSTLPREGLDQRTQHIMDWLVHMENARHGSLAYIDEVLGEYRKHEGALSMVNVQTAVRLLDEQLYTINRATAFGVSAQVTNAAESRVYYNLALKQLRIGDYAGFRHNIELSKRKDVRLTPAHAIAFSLRRWPSAASALAKLYERFVVRPRVDATNPRGD